jgi:hypothetical protein
VRAFDEVAAVLYASQPLRAFTEAHNSPTMDAQTERIAGNTWARKAAEKRSTVNVRNNIIDRGGFRGAASFSPPLSVALFPLDQFGNGQAVLQHLSRTRETRRLESFRTSARKASRGYDCGGRT